MRVLLVEDDVRMAAAVRRALRGAGVVADVATEAGDAMWMVGQAEYDAIVLDVMLPDVDGFELCRRLRKDRVWVPIVMLTAKDAVEDRVRGLDGGADDYLTKSPSRSHSQSCSRGCGHLHGGDRPRDRR
jgi:two-component system OmpR family response regulator